MLNLSAYTTSLEDIDDVPSPLMDASPELNSPALVVPVSSDVLETPAEFIEPIEGALPVIEEAVVLPPTIDPTPFTPLPDDTVQEEIIAENLDAEAGQLMGAQIALEGYSKLLRGAGKNMTRQSAAFMAVGMARANRIMGVTSLGLEDETSGTQVMAMKQANVDKEGLGSKLKDIGAKIWEWIKAQFAKLKALYEKLKAKFAKDKEQVVYLIAATDAVESGNPAKVKSLGKDNGLKVAQVLDAIHGEAVRKPEQKSITLPASLAKYIVRNGKLDLSLTVEADYRTKGALAYYADMTELANKITAYLGTITPDTPTEEIADKVSDIRKQTMVGKAGKWELPGLTVERTADGYLVAKEAEGGESTEVTLPSLPEIKQFLQGLDKVIDSQDPQIAAAAEKFVEAGGRLMSVPGLKSFPRDKAQAVGKALESVIASKEHGSMDSGILKVAKHLANTRSGYIAACDFFLTTYLGKGNSISQEDYLALPSSGPSGPGLGRRMINGAKEAWAKLKAYFQRLWDQFSNWVKNMWAKIFGTAKDTEILLLTNGAVPDEGESRSSTPGNVPALPQGTRLKSVQAARMLEDKSAGPEATPEPEVESPPIIMGGPAGAPAGFVLVPESVELLVGSEVAIDPVWEETMTNWLIRQYIPGQEKIVRDLISFAGSAELDGQGLLDWKEIIERPLPQLFQGMPTTGVPGLRTLTQGGGCKITVQQEGMMPQPQPVRIVKKRALDQALARQKKLLTALAGIEKGRIVIDRQRQQLNAMLDRRVAAGMSEESVTRFFNYVERHVLVSSASVIAAVIGKTCAARNAVADAMIVARAKGKR